MRWHSAYTTRIGIVVMPLMIGQLALSVIQAYAIFDFYSLIDLLFIIGVWMSTFLQFVPLHTSISHGDIDKKLMNRLTSLNWLRTLLWTLIFFWSLYIMV
ncbi:hypothetical protein [Aquimarina rubra]|uniref:Uncharacterized protein n=1 Tax=Aquimarina rubra TaxID=1920033 RepID=A0ABW5L8K2_9FLAO